MAERKNALRLGVIGLGQAGGMIIDEIKDAPDLPWKIAAAADPRAHARRQFETEFGVESYADAAELCKKAAVDVVYIATPPWNHLEHTIAAARNGKHIISEKPMALSLADSEAMVAVAKQHGVKLLAGHTHSFDAPILKMHELVSSGTYGELRAINAWNFNEFNHRPRLQSELEATHGPVLNQGPHHVDIVRQIGGGKVRSVRATTLPDIVTGVEGGYICYLEFENRVPATLVYDGRSLFDTAELFGWVGEGGNARDPNSTRLRRRAFLDLAGMKRDARDTLLEAQKEGGRYGAASQAPRFGQSPPRSAQSHQPFFGLVVVSCDNATLRQSADGLLVYDADGVHEVAVAKSRGGRIAELGEMYEAIVNDRAPFHDGAWGLATLEVCFGILESAKIGREVLMTRQSAGG